MPETKDLLLAKARFEDWSDLYQNVWSHPQTARYMLWTVTRSPEEAKERMERTLRFQKEHAAWTVYEKASGKAIGFGGVLQTKPGIWEDCGVAVGPEYVGRGYGKQILQALVDYVFAQPDAVRFITACRTENAPSRGTIRSCGFTFTHTEDRIDPRDGSPYILEFYRLDKERSACG